MRVLLWPGTAIMAAFPPPCFDRGPGKEPFCEGTPAQFFAGMIALVACVICCTVIFDWALREWVRRLRRV